MKVLFVGDQVCRPFVDKVEREGHHGFYVEVDELDCSGLEYDVAVVEGSGLDRYKRRLRKAGIPCIGPSGFVSSLREDRELFESVMLSAGICPAPTEVQKGRVSVWRDGVCILELDSVKEYRKVKEFLGEHQVQHLPNGFEVLIGGWFDGHSFAYPMLGLVSYKRMVDGGMGPFSQPPMGMVGWVENHRPRVYKETLEKMVPMLRKDDYRGFIGLEVSLKKNDVCVTNVVDGIVPLVPYLKEGVRDGITEVIARVARGDCKKWFCSPSYYVGAMISAPIQNVPVLGLVEGNQKHLLLSGVKDGVVQDDIVGYCTAWGKSIGEAKRRVYRTLETITVPYGIWRTDLGDKIGRPIQRVGHWL